MGGRSKSVLPMAHFTSYQLYDTIEQNLVRYLICMRQYPLCLNVWPMRCGGSALAPENTLVAFRNAMTLPVDAIELDVHMSRDGHMVVFHDNTWIGLRMAGQYSGLDFDCLRSLNMMHAVLRWVAGAAADTDIARGAGCRERTCTGLYRNQNQ